MATSLSELRISLPPLTPEEALVAHEKGALLLDVREGEERASHGLFTLARAIPRGRLELALDPARPEHDASLAGAEAVVCVCSDGVRAALAARTLRAAGKEAHWMEGGVSEFAAAGGVTEQVEGGVGIGIEGVGGVFLKARDHDAIRGWYRDVLGLGIDPAWGGLTFPWRQADQPDQPGGTVFSIFPGASEYFGSGPDGAGQAAMVNLRVRDLPAFLERLAGHGVTEVSERQDMDGFGLFAWIEDPEGRRIELWQPAPGL